ncbi:MAG: hypothetical protein ACXV47_06355 [Halobacteriota archaeon]
MDEVATQLARLKGATHPPAVERVRRDGFEGGVSSAHDVFERMLREGTYQDIAETLRLDLAPPPVRSLYGRYGTFHIIFHTLAIVRIHAGIAEHILKCDHSIWQLGLDHCITVDSLLSLLRILIT